MRNARHDGRAPEVQSGDLDNPAHSTDRATPARHHSTTPTLLERREIEAARLRKKRTDPIYLARELAANAARMRERRERLRRRHAISEARA